MPTYIYRREDGSTFEIQQRISEEALTTCPTTGQPVRRVISGKAGLLFKGDGFYLTDYTSYGKEGGTSSAKKEEGSASTPSETKTAAADSTPAATTTEKG